jgi:hypothetical protein
VYYLHTSISQIEFESRCTEVAGKWRRDFPEFARYFSAQWILGTFMNWKIYCSCRKFELQLCKPIHCVAVYDMLMYMIM